MSNVAISLRLNHPTVDPEWITAGMGLAEAIECALTMARPARAFLNEFIEGGGRAELFIGWFGGRGDTLECGMLGELAELGLDLSFDVYLDDGPAKPERELRYLSAPFGRGSDFGYWARAEARATTVEAEADMVS